MPETAIIKFYYCGIVKTIKHLGETEVQKPQVSLPKSHCLLVVEPEFKLKSAFRSQTRPHFCLSQHASPLMSATAAADRDTALFSTVTTQQGH